MKCFMHLPYASVINESYLCVHGGISPYLRHLDDIDQIEKPLLTSESQIATDLVWSDPNESAKGFQVSIRGSGYYFNDKRLNNFLKENRLKKLIRSHESCDDGYDYPLQNCITIFSNTDYCEMQNNAAVIRVNFECSSEISDNDDDDDESFVCRDDAHLVIERFEPLDEEAAAKRRVIVPEELLAEKDVCGGCCIETHDIFESISAEAICVF